MASSAPTGVGQAEKASDELLSDPPFSCELIALSHRPIEGQASRRIKTS